MSHLEREARYLQSIAVFVVDPEKHDELQRKAQAMLDEAKGLRLDKEKSITVGDTP